MSVTPLWRRAVAEGIGTGLLVTVVVGSGIAAATLSPNDVGLQLLENAFATALGLAVLILMIGPVSGAHFNPLVSAVDWFTSSTSFANPAVAIGRAFSDTFAGIAPGSLPGFVIAQIAGATVGVGLLALLYPRAGRAADDVVTPHSDTTASTGASK